MPVVGLVYRDGRDSRGGRVVATQLGCVCRKGAIDASYTVYEAKQQGEDGRLIVRYNHGVVLFFLGTPRREGAVLKVAEPCLLKM